jgi:hypothetical protein
LLASQGGGDAVGGVCEDGVETIAGGLDYPAVVGLDGFTHQGVVPGGQPLHQIGVVFPKGRAVFQVGEEKCGCAQVCTHDVGMWRQAADF